MSKKQPTYPMTDIANLLGPMIRVTYVLQMARSKAWTRKARVKWLKILKDSAWTVYGDANNMYAAELRKQIEENRRSHNYRISHTHPEKIT